MTFLRLWGRNSKGEIGAWTFLDLYADLLTLVFPEAEVRAALATGGDFQKDPAAVQALMACNMVGASIFAAAGLSCNSAAFAGRIESDLDALEAAGWSAASIVAFAERTDALAAQYKATR